MYKNYLVVAWRHLLRNKVNALINIGGLALAMACASIIILFVENELSYDKFHTRSGDMYRVMKDFVNEDGTHIPDATTVPALAPTLRAELPEVEAVTRFSPNRGRLFQLQHEDKTFYETSLISVDSNFFQVFNFEFVSGDKFSALGKTQSMILTETTAKKYFGNEDPINKIIRVNLNNGLDFVVTGVIKDCPQNSHFTFDIIIPIISRRDPDTNWDFSGFYTYVRLKSQSNAAAFESNVQAMVKKHKPQSTDEYHVQRLEDIHLTSKLKLELGENGDLLNVQIMMAIGIFVILIASINYINLVTAQSSKRAKEIGVRKVSGANRGILIRQFLTESVLMTVIALLLSIGLCAAFLPFTKSLFGYDFTTFWQVSKYAAILLPAFALTIGIVAGIYPALYLSGFEPLKSLKGNLLSSHGGFQLRHVLVVFQFVIASGLVIGTLTIIQQLDFMRKRDLGFSKDNVMLLPNVRGGIGSNAGDPATMIEEMKKIPGLLHIARADGVLGVNNSANGVGTKNQENHIALNFIRADYEFLPALEIQLTEGRNFSEDFASDSSAIILNETAAAQLGLKAPYVGQQLAWDDSEGKTREVTIIGMAKDFHFNSFRETIRPFGFILEVGNGSTFFLKMESANLAETITAVEKVWKTSNPDRPFVHTFQDEHYARLQMAETRFQNLFSVFTGLAIVITCLGIFGLITYIAKSKVKEIGIRKVLGASVNAIVILLTKDFLGMIIVSFVISFPIAYYLMQNWLDGFAYHSTLGWEVFAATIVVSIVIVFGVVSFQAVRAALMDPVKSLKEE